MKERPILFSAPMVRGLLNDTKTQTRRVAKPVRHPDFGNIYSPGALVLEHEPKYVIERACPYGQPGDRLWVRESGWERPERTAKMMRKGADTWPRYAYASDNWNDQDRADFKAWGFKNRPSIHMPRWASRITLEVTGVRVERLQDIGEADAIAEGIERSYDQWRDYRTDQAVNYPSAATPIESYRTLWESINGPGSWDANPWVWVVEFNRLEGGAA